MQYKRFEELPVWRDAVELARRVYEFTSLRPFERHAGLRDQLERAALSISNNVAEGFERGSSNELLAFLYIARGSAGEVRSMLQVLERWNGLGDLKSQIADLKAQSERISKQLYGWIETLKNSDITGQRHFDERARSRREAQKQRDNFLEELGRLRERTARGKPESPAPISEAQLREIDARQT